VSTLASRYPAVSRHWQVLRESWRSQNLADRAFRERAEHEFLPAALEVMESPPSPGLRMLLWLTCGLFTLALLWAVLGKVDVVAVAPGKVVPAGNVKLIQPIEIGAVRAIHVRNGQFVRKGQLLIELDSTLASAAQAQSELTLGSARILQARNDALLAYLEGRAPTFVAPAGTPDAVLRTEQAFVRNAIAQYEAERAALSEQREAKQAELAAARAEVAKLRESLPYLERQLSARAELAEKGYYSRLRLLEYEQLRVEHVRNIEIQTANAARAAAAVGSLDAELSSLRANFAKAAVSELADANDRVGAATEDVRMSARRRQFHELRAPVDGVVQQLAVNTVGGIVEPAQPLMVIVPCSSERASSAACTGSVTVEALVDNKDIGFVRAGQRVAVKLEAFSFTDYGLIDGTVETISRDAIDQSQATAGTARDGGREARSSLVYAARITLACAPANPDRSPLCDRVQPGMAVQAEIKTGRRRIIAYVTSPISRTVSEAGRER
jgi:hemolysin D